MSDIMERLRGLADLFEAGDAPRHVVMHMRAGADEIERKKAEIASLLNALADARTESMRLRAALEMFACDCIESGNLCPSPHACRNYVARAALAKQSTTEEERA